MRTLDQVRAMFPIDTVVEVVEHTGRPDFKGQRRRVLKAQQKALRVEILDGPMAGERNYWMSLPERAGDVRELTENQVSFVMAGTDHTLTVRLLAADENAGGDDPAASERVAA